MHKKRALTFILASILLIFILIVIFSGNLKLSGFATYGAGNPFCGADVIDDSSITANQLCSVFGIGGNLTAAGITLDCTSKTVSGDDSLTTYGILTTANNQKIINCKVTDFGYNINISSNNISIINSIINVAAQTAEAFISPGFNATFLNVSFTNANVQVSTGASIAMQYYIRVNVTNSSGGAVNGATVRLYNVSSLSSQLSGSTGSDGLVYFNVTRGVKQNSAYPNFTYWINATSGSSYGENTSVDIPISTTTTQININLSASDSTAPLIRVIYPTNTSYNAVQTALNFTVSDETALSTCWYFNGTANLTITCGANATTGLSSLQGSNTWVAYANDSSNNLNSSKIIFTVDSVYPTIQFAALTETSGTTQTRNNIQVNVTAVDTNLVNITISLFNSSGSRIRYNTTSTSPNTINYTNMADGTYYFNATALDSLVNSNSTETRNITIDTALPLVTINFPTNTTYSTASVTVNISINENGTCFYSSDSGITNITLTNNANRQFTGSAGAFSNGGRIINAYCNDTAGNTNYSTSIAFSINVPAGDGGSGGGSGGGGGVVCTPVYDCSDWSICTNGNQTRLCVDNKCASPDKIEKQACTACTNECPQTGTYCSANNLETCSLVSQCLKITNSKTCSNGCSNGQCLEPKSPLSNVFQNINIPDIRPSKIIPHGNIPDIVVDVGAATIGTAAIGGIAFWLWWLWILAILPFFLIKLRHYSVSIFDSANALKLFNNKLNKQRLYDFMARLEKEYGPIVFASKTEELTKYLVKKGFIEIRADSPFIMTAHFSSKKEADRFAYSLKKVLNLIYASKIQVLRVTERASIIGAWRAYRRRKKSEREIRKFIKN